MKIFFQDKYILAEEVKSMHTSSERLFFLRRIVVSIVVYIFPIKIGKCFIALVPVKVFLAKWDKSGDDKKQPE